MSTVHPTHFNSGSWLGSAKLSARCFKQNVISVIKVNVVSQDLIGLDLRMEYSFHSPGSKKNLPISKFVLLELSNYSVTQLFGCITLKWVCVSWPVMIRVCFLRHFLWSRWLNLSSQFSNTRTHSMPRNIKDQSWDKQQVKWSGECGLRVGTVGTQFALTASVLQNHFKISLIGAFLTVRVLLLGKKHPSLQMNAIQGFFCFKHKFSFNTCYFSKLDCFECSICMSEAVQLIPMFQSFSFDHTFKVMGDCLVFRHSKMVNWVVCSL